MTAAFLDKLLLSLDVGIDAFTICEVGAGVRLLGDAVNAVEVHYVIEGTLHLMTPGADTLVCGTGAMVILPAGLAKTMAADDMPVRDVVAADSCAMTRDGMLLVDAADGLPGDLRLACGIVMASRSGSFGLLDMIRAPIAVDLNDQTIVAEAFRLMLSELADPGFGSRALIGALMKTCLVMFLRRHVVRSQEPVVFGATQDPRLGRAVAAILDKPAAAHTVASLAGVAAMSRSTFAREFAAAFDMSPMEFVAKTRLHHAADLLRSSPAPIKVIAASIGFSSRSHFSRAFRQAYGHDPRSFRKSASQAIPDAPAPLHGSRRIFALAEEGEG